MSFLSAAFLLGLPLLAVPVAIHLFSRRRQEVVKWGAMQFLMDNNIRRRKIWRLDDLFLMLLRALTVLGIILALARPLWHRTGPGGGLGRDVVFVWDVSMSMEREFDVDRTSFDQLIDKTKEVFDQLGPRDSVRGLVTIGRGKWLATESHSASLEQKQFLLNELKNVGVTQASADWVACLGTALRATPPRDAKAKLIVVMSDGQENGWHQQDPSAWENLARLTEESRIPVAIEIYNVIGAAPAAHNLSIDKLTTPRQLLGVGETIHADAEVHNYGQIPVQQVTVNWLLNDESLGRSSVGPIAPGQSRQVSLKHVLNQPGISQLSCRMELRDDLKNDNERTVILETIDHVPILLVDDSTERDPLKSDTGYLLAALGQAPTGEVLTNGSSIFRVTMVTSNELAKQTLSNFRAIVFSNTPDLFEGAYSKLMEYVRTGGGLWLALGDRTNPDEFNLTFYHSGGGLCPWPIEPAKGDLIRREEFITIHPPDGDHPATTLISDTQRLDIDRVKVFQRFPFVTAAAKIKVPVLLQSGTGEALAIENFVGRGRVIIQSIPMGVRWSNLPLMQAYVPMVHEWLWYLMQPTAISRNLLPGEPLLASLPQNEHIREVHLKRPDRVLLNLATFTKGDQLFVQSRETQLPGSYEVHVKIEGKEYDVQTYQVARQKEESNLDQWSQELIAKLNGNPLFRLNPNSPLQMPHGTLGQSLGEPLWTRLLVLVVIAFLTEIWLVRRIARKRFASNVNSSSYRSITDRMLGRTAV